MRLYIKEIRSHTHTEIKEITRERDKIEQKQLHATGKTIVREGSKK